MAQTQNNQNFWESKNAFGFLVFFVLVLPLSVQALQDPTLVTKVPAISRWSLETGFEYSQNISKGEESKRDESLDISLIPGYRINDTFKVIVKSFISKDNTGADDTQISDTVVTLSIRGYELGPELTSLHSLSGIIPTSERSQKRDRLQGAIGFSNGLHYAGPVWDVTYRLGYTQNIHEFDANAEGSANVQHSLSNSLSLQLKLSEKTYLTTLGIYRSGLTYGGKGRSSFEIHSDINWDVTDKMTLNFGTSNAGQALKANGVESNISAFDADTSVIRAGISMSL